MDFALSNDHRAIIEAVERVIAPFDDAYWLAKDQAGGFPHDFHEALAKAG